MEIKKITVIHTNTEAPASDKLGRVQGSGIVGTADSIERFDVTVGHGVIEGLEVEQNNDSPSIVVEPGMAMDAYGNEIEIPADANAIAKAKLDQPSFNYRTAEPEASTHLQIKLGIAPTLFSNDDDD